MIEISWIYFFVILIFRLIAIITTYYSVGIYGTCVEGNPIMRCLFNKFGYKVTLSIIFIISMILTAFIASYPSFLLKVIFFVIMAADAVNDSFFFIKEYQKMKK